MSVKTGSSTKYSCTKVLVVVALLACINVVFAASVSNGVTRSSQTLKTSNVVHADVPKRFLRADTTVTTDDRTNLFQERALAISLPGLEGLASSIKSGLSKLIQKLRLRWGRLRQKSADDVFTLLKLDKTGNKLFENPVFSQWAAFVTVRNKNDPDMAMFATLAKYYSDDALAKMLTTAKEVDSTKAIATKMEGLQITNWLKAGDSADDVFKSLRLDRTGGKLFESAAFPNWVAFVAKRNSKDPELAMFSTFATRYSDDALAKMLSAAKEVESTKAIATKMESLQITNWVNAGSSADDVFKILKLDQTGNKLFESPVFSNWVSFVAKRNTKDPELAMFSTFATRYSDDALAKMLVAAKEVESTKAIATKMESLQITNWVNAEKSSDNVFKILKLDQTGDKLFESPVLSTWTSFVTKANKDNPNEIMVAQLADRFGEVALAKMISAATKVDSTEKLATDLRSVQFKNWLNQGRTPQHVDTMLKGGANSDDVTKKISRDYEMFYGKIKVTDSTRVDTGAEITSTRTGGNGIRIG